jgi:hypothetical protein
VRLRGVPLAYPTRTRDLWLGKARTFKRSPGGTSATCQPKRADAPAGATAAARAQARTALRNPPLTVATIDLLEPIAASGS